MAKEIAVTGATGKQGGSVVRELLKYPEQYKVVALTRDPESESAKRLIEKGCKVVKANLDDQKSLEDAFK
jgi:uncharacterized protein YbjT (DUF2867 family)